MSSLPEHAAAVLALKTPNASTTTNTRRTTVLVSRTTWGTELPNAHLDQLAATSSTTAVCTHFVNTTLNQRCISACAKTGFTETVSSVTKRKTATWNPVFVIHVLPAWPALLDDTFANATLGTLEMERFANQIQGMREISFC